MNIDFTNQIKKLKEKDVLHKPFPAADGGYALFAKNQEGNFVRLLFPNQDHIKKYLNDLGYDWGNEGKDEFRNFDCLSRLLTVMPELSEVETIAADPQWEISEKAVDLPGNSSTRDMEDIPDAVELREVDHPIGYDDRTHASEDKKKDKKKGKKLPPWLNKDKKDDKKGDKKGDKKNGKKGDEEGKDKNGKKLPPWLNKKKSKSNYSELWEKVNSEAVHPKAVGEKSFALGDMVKNINPDCKHFESEGEICGRTRVMGKKTTADHKPGHEEEEDELGFVFAYKTTNAGKNWDEGDTLEKTPDQLEKIKGMKKV